MSDGVLPFGWRYVDKPDPGIICATNGHSAIEGDDRYKVVSLVWRVEEKSRAALKRGVAGNRAKTLASP